MDRVGLVGLGTLGLPMAGLLARAGMPPVVHDVRAEAVGAALEAGARGAADPADVAARADVVLVCVQTDEQCDDVVRGSGGLLDTLAPCAVIAVLATVHPDTVTELASAAAARGVSLVDSPLAGKGAGGLEDRTMWAFVGGDAALKLAHNVMVYVGYLATFEALPGVTLTEGMGDALYQVRRPGPEVRSHP